MNNRFDGSLQAFFTHTNPRRAINYYRELENPLEAFARACGYEKVDGDLDGATLYVRK
jgi:hypothetical protein